MNRRTLLKLVGIAPVAVEPALECVGRVHPQRLLQPPAPENISPELVDAAYQHAVNMQEAAEELSRIFGECHRKVALREGVRWRRT
jgi:hypothetical protein